MTGSAVLMPTGKGGIPPAAPHGLLPRSCVRFARHGLREMRTQGIDEAFEPFGEARLALLALARGVCGEGRYGGARSRIITVLSRQIAFDIAPPGLALLPPQRFGKPGVRACNPHRRGLGGECLLGGEVIAEAPWVNPAAFIRSATATPS